MEMSVSQLVNENGKKVIYIRFTEGKRFAEGKYPDCKIVKNEGFSASETDALEKYMGMSGDKIEELAKSINLWNALGTS